MFNLEKQFYEIDKINNIEELKEIMYTLKDASYTKLFWEQRDIAITGETEEIRLKARLKCNLIAKKYCASVAISKKVNRFTTPHGFAGIHISVDDLLEKGVQSFNMLL